VLLIGQTKLSEVSFDKEMSGHGATNPTEDEVKHIFREGQLEKKGQTFLGRGWSTRHFILREGELAWFEKSDKTDDKHQAGCLPTDSIVEVRSRATHPFDLKVGDIEIHLTNGEKPRQLRSLCDFNDEAAADDAAEWMEAFGLEKTARATRDRGMLPVAVASVPANSSASQPAPPELEPEPEPEPVLAAALHVPEVIERVSEASEPAASKESVGVLDGLSQTIDADSVPPVATPTDAETVKPATPASNTAWSSWREGFTQDNFVPNEFSNMSSTPTYSDRHGVQTDLTERLVPLDECEDDEDSNLGLLTGCCEKCCGKCRQSCVIA